MTILWLVISTVQKKKKKGERQNKKKMYNISIFNFRKVQLYWISHEMVAETLAFFQKQEKRPGRKSHSAHVKSHYRLVESNYQQS